MDKDNNIKNFCIFYYFHGFKASKFLTVSAKYVVALWHLEATLSTLLC